MYLLEKQTFYLLYGGIENAYKINVFISNQGNSFVKEISDSLLKVYETTRIKNKNPFIGAILSTFIPGLGKIYAGKKAEGFVAMISNFLYIGSAFELLIKLGPQNAYFITVSTIAGIFYIGNIEGSYFAVIRRKKETYAILHQKLFNVLFIPFRYYLFK